MSLGDGLARSLRKYMQAKQEVGLKALLLGETSVEQVAEKAANGNGTKGNGAGKGNGNGNGASHVEPVVLDRMTTKAPLRGDGRGFQWQQKEFKVVCPDCQSELRFSEGCMTCEGCGFSKC